MSDAGSPSRRPERVLVDLAAMERMDLAPPPPARFTTLMLPRNSRSISGASVRATMSVPPPAG